MLRTDVAYTDASGKLTQAGFQALQAFADKAQLEALDALVVAQAADIAALEANPVITAPGAAPSYACRAWVNFNGTGTVAIRASGNVASITDNGVGDYTINFTTAMPDADYAFVMASGNASAGGSVRVADGVSPTASSIRIQTLNNTGTALADASFVSVAIFR